MEFTIKKLSFIFKILMTFLDFDEMSFSVLESILELTFISRFIHLMNLASSFKLIMFEEPRVIKTVASLKNSLACFLSIL